MAFTKGWMGKGGSFVSVCVCMCAIHSITMFNFTLKTGQFEVCFGAFKKKRQFSKCKIQQQQNYMADASSEIITVYTKNIGTRKPILPSQTFGMLQSGMFKQ